MFVGLLSLGLVLRSPPLLHAPTAARSDSITMGWDDPNWNWGSAIGTAHDEAMKVRAALSTPEARKDFLFTVFAGQADPEEAKMALALKCQRARNLGYDANDWEGLSTPLRARCLDQQIALLCLSLACHSPVRALRLSSGGDGRVQVRGRRRLGAAVRRDSAEARLATKRAAWA